ncbi:MAG: T9SS type A sorting domain-containing protein, partial [Saprospiraceae bacterium]|nr:T9SS type A sorting domain-containing protein [Saprospiraceae bacterium]
NEANPEWGAAGSTLRHITSQAYADGIAAPSGADRPNPRTISNDLFTQLEAIYDGHNLTDYTWVFGQFVDHDITLIHNSETEPALVSVPSCDPIFDPTCTGNSVILMMRSAAAPGSGTSGENPRTFANQISVYLDASAVYGSDPIRANWLRTHVDGKLKVSSGNLLPFNTLNGEINGITDRNAPEMDRSDPDQNRYFVAGDFRANENVMLTAMHTLFVREHNRKCDLIKAENPNATDEEIYQKARKLIGGYIQNIVYREWLPSMGVVLDDYAGYRPDVNANVSNVFSAAAFRFGHTLLSSNLLRMDDGCETLPQGDLTLRNSFFNPALVVSTGIEPLVKGMSAQIQQRLDCKVIDDVRNFLFGPPGFGFGLDLAAININRGRERGLPDYNSIRDELGLGRVKTFDEILADPVEARIMEDLYGNVDMIDPWVGMLAEAHLPGAMFGETIMAIMKEQFKALRDGDRFYFENDPTLSAEEKEEIRHTKLAKIVKRNTSLQAMQENVFVMERKCHKIVIEEKHLALKVSPNPVRSEINLDMFSFEEGDANVIISDMLGNRVIQVKIPVEKGINSFNLNVAQNLPTGFYNIHVHMNQRFNALKLLKVD